MKICCLVPSLNGGGAERVMVNLCNRWAIAGHRVRVVTLDAGTGDTYRLDPRVERVTLALLAESRSFIQAVRMNLRRLRALRRAIRSFRADVAVSFNAPMNVLAVLACRGTGVPVVVSERVHPPSHGIGFAWEALRRLTYRLASAVVVQTEAAKQWAERIVSGRRLFVIPNAITVPFVRPDRDFAEARRPVVLGVGRLVTQKGFDLLIKAFALIRERHSDWSISIIGEGPEAAALRRLAADTLPAASVTFLGHVAEPERSYRTAGLFVLPSRFEGFPNALLEAMATGCAVIAADCAAGPAEIVRSGVDGILVPPGQVEALAAAMDRLMSDSAERVRLGARAREVATRFAFDRIMPLWDDVIRGAQNS